MFLAWFMPHFRLCSLTRRPALLFMLLIFEICWELKVVQIVKNKPMNQTSFLICLKAMSLILKEVSDVFLIVVANCQLQIVVVNLIFFLFLLFWLFSLMVIFSPFLSIKFLTSSACTWRNPLSPHSNLIIFSIIFRQQQRFLLRGRCCIPVSYTHLTLPTILLV